MRSSRSLFLLTLITVANAGSSFVKKNFNRIANDVQIVSEELFEQLKQKGGEYRDSNWPKDIDRRKVDLTKISDEVLQMANTWIRTMIKNKWLPRDFNNFMVGIRKEEYHKADYLILRYKVDGYNVQVQENGVAVCILIEDVNAIQKNQKIEDYVTKIVREFLNYPQDKMDSLRFYLKNFKYNGKIIYYGTMDCDFDVYSRNAWAKRIWGNHTYIWTDGKKIYFSLVEMDGKPLKKTQAKPGIPPGFNKNKP